MLSMPCRKHLMRPDHLLFDDSRKTGEKNIFEEFSAIMIFCSPPLLNISIFRSQTLWQSRKATMKLENEVREGAAERNEECVHACTNERVRVRVQRRSQHHSWTKCCQSFNTLVLGKYVCIQTEWVYEESPYCCCNLFAPITHTHSIFSFPSFLSFLSQSLIKQTRLIIPFMAPTRQHPFASNKIRPK